jgi:hypothetical protein
MGDYVMRPVVDQAGYIVDDVFAAMTHWQRHGGAGPFFLHRISGDEGPGRSLYRGQPYRFQGLIALSFVGDLQIELIQQTNDTASVYTETLKRCGPGFHHFKWRFDDYDAACARFAEQGIALAWEVEVPGITRVAYWDMVAQLGHFIEMSDASPAFAERTEEMRRTCAEWDGVTDPVREMASF